jgi:hypothetical protein
MAEIGAGSEVVRDSVSRFGKRAGRDGDVRDRSTTGRSVMCVATVIVDRADAPVIVAGNGLGCSYREQRHEQKEAEAARNAPPQPLARDARLEAGWHPRGNPSAIDLTRKKASTLYSDGNSVPSAGRSDDFDG